MLRQIVLGLAGVMVFVSAAAAQTCPNYTYTLTNGTTADASQVMGNFNSILNCANNSLLAASGGTLTGGTLAGTTTLPSSSQISSSGYLGIGKAPTVPIDIATGNLSIGTIGVNGRLLIDTSTDTTTRIKVNRGGTTGSLAFHTGADTEQVWINSTGSVYLEHILTGGSGTQVYIDPNSSPPGLLKSGSSSIAIKKNVKSLITGKLISRDFAAPTSDNPVPSVDEMFARLVPVSFNYALSYEDQTKPYFGFVAEQAASITPALATLAHGKPINIDERAILAVTVAELQKVKTANDKLQQEIDDLKHRSLWRVVADAVGF